jgi:hypothetical protein
MANQNFFTYNTSSYISGTEQIGNLAAGITEQDYASNLGNARWWGGPDETGRYIIAKDVPNSTHPSPLGNVGNVRFWSSDENDSDFIFRVNTLPARAGQSPFTTTTQCLTFLSESEYWTNYNEINAEPIQSASSNTFLNLSGIAPYWYSVIYNESTSDFYVANDRTQTSIRVPAVINGDDIPYPLPVTKSGVKYFLQTSSFSPTARYVNGLAFKSSSNELFAPSFGPAYPYSGSGYLSATYLSKWKVDEMSGLFTGSLASGSDFLRSSNSGSGLTDGYISSDIYTPITYNPQDDLLYFGGQYYDGSDFYTGIFTYPVSNWQKPIPDTEIIVKTENGSNNYYPLLFSSTDNSGKVLVMRDYEITSNVDRNFYITRNGSILATGSFDAKLRVFSAQKQVIYSEDQQKWYWGGTTYDFDGIWLASVNSNTYEVDRIQYESDDQTTGAGDVTNIPIALDKNRNCIWALGRKTTGGITYYVYAIYLPTFSVTKYRIPYNPQIASDADNTTTPTILSVDSNNDRLFIFRANAVYSWNLNDIWPI